MRAKAEVNIARKNEEENSNKIPSVTKTSDLHPELLQVPEAVVVNPKAGLNQHQSPLIRRAI